MLAVGDISAHARCDEGLGDFDVSIYIFDLDMTYQDLLITPIYLAIFYFLAYIIRPSVTTPETKKYFIPALSAKFFGAIALGLLYQFYYGGGDTFNYFTHGSRWIWEAFLDSPATGFRLLSEQGGIRQEDTFNYSQNIWYYRDVQAFFVVRIVSIFDLFTIHTYSATALFFAAFSFTGSWALYSVVVRLYPNNPKWLAIAILFIPSVVFWGSGILKDTLTFGALGWCTYALFQFIELDRNKVTSIVIFILSSYLIVSIKSYIFFCLVPSAFLWYYLKRISQLASPALKIVIAPILFLLVGGLGIIATQQFALVDEKYSLDNVAQVAAVTAYDIRYGWGARTGGDGGYDLGTLDGSWGSMIRLMPAAINVSLFRPYPWEVRNPLMLLSALEAILTLILTFNWVRNGNWKGIAGQPFIAFSLVFSLIFAFAVGVSTYNFGTLMRYKLPLLPFFYLVVIPKKHSSTTYE